MSLASEETWEHSLAMARSCRNISIFISNRGNISSSSFQSTRPISGHKIAPMSAQWYTNAEVTGALVASSMSLTDIEMIQGPRRIALGLVIEKLY